MKKDKKIQGFIFFIALLLGVLTGCCEHVWMEADCENPMICSECGSTKGEALGHDVPGLTCINGGVCSRCQEEISAPGHKISSATCVRPEECTVCGEIYKEALGHSWEDASCLEPKTCSACGETEGDALGHTWVVIAEGKPRECSTCKEVEDTRIAVPNNASSYRYDAYADVVEELRNAGFNNIEVSAQYDLTTGWLDSARINDVETVTINGSNEFQKGDLFAPDAKVVIIYRALIMDDPNIKYEKISVSKLMKEIESNAARAKDDYEDSYVQITGRVENIDSDGDYFYLYPSDDEWALIGVQCNLLTDEQIAFIKTLSEGDIIAIRGEITYVSEYGCSLDVFAVKW